MPVIERQIDIVFDRPTPFTRRGVGYRPAYKNRPVARVFIKDIQARYRTREYGGVRMPRKRALVLPVGQRSTSTATCRAVRCSACSPDRTRSLAR